MARIRTIKPEFFTSEVIGELTVNSRLLYVALWCQVDREGRGKFQRVALAAQCMPYEMDQFNPCWDELIEKGLIIQYEADNKKYFKIPTFNEHQRPHNTEKQSEIPDFNGDLTVKEPLDNSKPSTGKGKGKGTDKNTYVETKVSTCPHEEIINTYHETLPAHQRVVTSRWPGSTRAKNLQTRWKEDQRHQKLDFWKAFFETVKTNPHWMGENDRQWKPDLGWLLKRENFDKVIERAMQ